MSGPPRLEKRVSLRSQQRIRAAAAAGHADADRADQAEMSTDEQQQEELNGRTTGRYPEEQQSSSPPAASRLHRHQSDHSLTSQVEAVTALSELFQPHPTPPPPSHQRATTPDTPTQMDDAEGTPTPMQHQPAGYTAQPFLPPFLPYNQLMSPTSGIPPQHLANSYPVQGALPAQHLFHPPLLLHSHLSSGQFLSPPPALSPMGGYRSFHLSPPAIPAAHPGAPLHAASSTSHLSPYHSTRLPILHDWFFANRRARPPRGPMELPAPEFDPVDLDHGTAAFVDSLRSVLRGNAHDLPRCLPLEDLTTTPQLINALQFSRYARRSAARKRRVTRLPGSIKHVSRQLHAARRVRGKGGRFLTKEEKEQMARDAELNVELGLGAAGEIEDDIEPEAEEDER